MRTPPPSSAAARPTPAQNSAPATTSTATPQNLLPRNVFGPDPTALFVAGDDRVNDNVPLTALHTVFMREHNRLVDAYAAQHPDWSSEELYQHARRTVGAQLQAITYNEYLPALLGPAAPSPTGGQYNPNLKPAVFNEFAAVFERAGHSMLTPSFLRIQNDGQAAPGGPVSLIDGFNNPSKLSSSNELSLFLKGLSVEVQDETDIEDRDRHARRPPRRHRHPARPRPRPARLQHPPPGLRPPEGHLLRRDHLRPSPSPGTTSLYSNVNSIDPLVGALAEDHLPGSSVGPLLAAGLGTQFELLRDADRFWYERDPAFTPAELDMLRNTRLSDVIMRNTDVTNLQGNVFFVPEPSAPLILAGVLATLACGRTKRKSR